MHRWLCPWGKPRGPLGILPQSLIPLCSNMVILLFSAFLTYHLPGSRGCCCLMCFISDVTLMFFRTNRSTEEARGKLRLGKPSGTWLYLITAQTIYFGFQKKPPDWVQRPLPCILNQEFFLPKSQFLLLSLRKYVILSKRRLAGWC